MMAFINPRIARVALAVISPRNLSRSSARQRCYTVAAHRSSEQPLGVTGDIDADAKEMNDRLSRRLFKTLLRGARAGVPESNGSNCIRNADSNQILLLQPLFDQRKYGFAQIFNANRGQIESDLSKIGNPAARRMERLELGRALEVLKFLHISLGGDHSDDLEDYYLGGSAVGDENHHCSDGEPIAGAAAGRHAEGHYTQFIDDDPERGEFGDKGCSDDDQFQIDESLLVSSSDIENAIRIAFRAPLVSDSLAEDTLPLSEIIATRHGDAISAFSLLNEQFKLWEGKSSVAVDLERGVRVVCTSACMSAAPSGKNNRYAYRIRVENIRDLDDKKVGTEEEKNSVQLLGRTWKIFDDGSKIDPLQHLLAKDETATDDSDNAAADVVKLRDVVVDPEGGAVGHFPVIRPGEVFTYMSGCEVREEGWMEGSFYMAEVDSETDSSIDQDTVEALQWKADDPRRFKAEVARFGLRVDTFR